MASELEPPVKRRRLSNDGVLEQSSSAAPISKSKGASVDANGQTLASDASDEQTVKEIRAGITTFVHPDAPGFSGILKQRYTDFLVNEILPDGRVLHLRNLNPPGRRKAEIQTSTKSEVEEQTDRENVDKAKSGTDGLSGTTETKGNLENVTNGASSDPALISNEDNASLISVFGEDVAGKVIALYQAVHKHPSWKSKDFTGVTSEPITEKHQRTQTHQLVRRIFKSKLETKTSDNETISITASPGVVKERGEGFNHNGPRIKNKQGWQELGGDYVHFTLYKENRDTMESISFLSRELKVGAKHFQFGGTKDRRAVTVQRCSAYRIHAGQLAAIGRNLRGSKIGDYEYHPAGLELGDLGGNEFVITLRDCHVPGEEGLGLDERVALAERVLTQTVGAFKDGGFLNYYGLQRFGSFATSTDEVGVKLLQGNLAGAIGDILQFNPAALDESTPLISSDDRARAEAIHIWNTTKKSEPALEKLPRKFSAESNIIRHLGMRNRKSGTYTNMTDYQGALQTIPRNLRLMYVHAYQSLVWNVIVGKRWELYGSHVVEGDLVLVSEHKSKVASNTTVQPTVDEQGEPIILASASNGTDTSPAADSPYEQARPLSANEAASGDYTIFDIVLPLPGFDVVYPSNAAGDEYKTFMASERGGRLDPYNMRRNWKDLSLSGSYRKILAKPGEDMSFEVKTYEKVEEQLVETDLERLQEKDNSSSAGGQVSTSGTNAGEVDGAAVDAEKKLAIILRMRLGPSQYATMALRELMKNGGVTTYKPDFGGGR